MRESNDNNKQPNGFHRHRCRHRFSVHTTKQNTLTTKTTTKTPASTKTILTFVFFSLLLLSTVCKERRCIFFVIHVQQIKICENKRAQLGTARKKITTDCAYIGGRAATCY